MFQRRATSLVQAALDELPAVVLLGPRQVGKTTLARAVGANRNAIYLDLEQPVDQRKLADDAAAFLNSLSDKLVIIDEIHRAPELFPVLRGIIDERRRTGSRAGHYLLLGSASLDLMNQASESLAGRVRYIELAPVDALEASSVDADELWSRGGFPESLLAPSDRSSLAWRRDFIRSYFERDVPMFAPRMPAETIRRFWTMLAHAQGSLLNQAGLAASLSVSAPTVARYLDLSVDLLLVRRLQPWSGNVGKRLTKSPKIYVRDSGLAHALLELEDLSSLLGHPVVGASWEGFVIENLIAAAGDARIPLFYRTQDGAEVDLLFERGGEIEMAIEIKRSSAPQLSKGFHSARQVLRPKQAYVVHGGHDEWPIADGVTAISLVALMRRLLA